MGKKSSPPAAPDPAATAAAQAAANKEAVTESAKVNQINEVTPYGSVSWSGDIGAPDRTKTTSLSPEGQLQLDQRNQLAELLGISALDRAGQMPQEPFALDGSMPRVSDFSGSELEQREFDRAMELMRPELQRQERNFESTMANRGIPLGGEAYSDARNQFDQARDSMIRGAAYDAMNAGNAEQSRLYNMARTERGDDINEQLLLRQQPMNELAAILQGTPAFQNPAFGSTAQYQISPADYAGAIQNKYNADLNAWNANQQSNNALLGGLSTLGSAAISLSDRLLKKNISLIGIFDGIKWYSYEYLWSPVKQVGVMAQDILKIKPEAVHRLPSGHYAVDYGAL